MDVNANPLFNTDISDVESSSTSSASISSDSYTAPAMTMPPAAVLQTVNIKTHVPVELDIAESNYTEWCCFFDAFVGKFGLSNHLATPLTPADRRDPNWIMRDQCILSWLYNSISKDVLAIFRGNELHRAVYLEGEFHSLVQGDMDVTTFTGRLKKLANAQRDVGQPVCETSQVLNMLRGLNSKFRHAVPVITSNNPPHTFLSVRSYLLLEEQYDREHAKATQH
ncbi:uncharacterized protein [Miscanthus floridulus]|uniref:uncharacterized protein n=1 Tax=Miscanthus floridulus TaxID=154761 RepID=UPI003457AF29